MRPPAPQHNIEVISEVSVASIQGHLREAAARTADYTIIDLAGARDAIVTTAIGLSDHVMIPVELCHGCQGRGADP